MLIKRVASPAETQFIAPLQALLPEKCYFYQAAKSKFENTANACCEPYASFCILSFAEKA